MDGPQGVTYNFFVMWSVTSALVILPGAQNDKEKITWKFPAFRSYLIRWDFSSCTAAVWTRFALHCSSFGSSSRASTGIPYREGFRSILREIIARIGNKSPRGKAKPDVQVGVSKPMGSVCHSLHCSKMDWTFPLFNSHLYFNISSNTFAVLVVTTALL